MTTDLNALRQSAEKILALRKAVGDDREFVVMSHPYLNNEQIVMTRANSVRPLGALLEKMPEACDTLAAMLPLIGELEACRKDALTLDMLLKSDVAVLADCPDPNAVEQRVKAALLKAFKRIEQNRPLKGNMAALHTEPDGSQPQQE